MTILATDQLELVKNNAVPAHSSADGDPNDADHREPGAGASSEASQVDSDDDSSDSEDDSEEEDEEETRLGPIDAIKQRLLAKQQRWMDARRHPILEWKAEEQWARDNAAHLARQEEERRRNEARKAERSAKRERKEKRRAQQRFTKEKEQDFRATLFQYELDVIKADKRRTLITKFAREDRAKRKRLQAEQDEADRLAAERKRQEDIEAALELDRSNAAAVHNHVQQQIAVGDELGRRIGLLPAINTPPPQVPPVQDETSHVLILRLNPNSSPKLQRQSSTTTLSSNLPTVQSSSGQRERIAETPFRSSSTKRLFFTVNLKRFKHVEEIRGEQIGDPGGVELARSLLTGACPRVKTIYLGWNQIKYSAITALCDCFFRGACGQLQLLDLRCNSIDAKSTASLISVFDQGGLPELVELILQGNNLGDEGAKALAHAMLRGTFKGLHRIDIRQNRIRNGGVLAIWNVFTADCKYRYCPKLELLDLRRNEAQGSLTRTFCPCPPYLEF
ncbi:hypothetical protein Poli38472_013787 [Pythium oligandrum]|uniref:Uncharacterized protein n=1 Tax=Pythium oligandrum TaxID=41045 RepID=A0A8K1C240_PYTOL|nr:hypothetical protein Poli38472_013787 [Pythium oligandrum]|eukprot:TMW55025.1 hypothetical protein Poli38472_013787 [Pythium oligandrum]